MMENMGCPCVFGIDFLKFSGTQTNFPGNSIMFENLNESVNTMQEEKLMDWPDSSLSEDERKQLQKLINDFAHFFSDMRGLTHVTSYSINTGNKAPVKTKYCRYDKVKTEITEKHVAQLLNDGIIERMPRLIVCQ